MPHEISERDRPILLRLRRITSQLRKITYRRCSSRAKWAAEDSTPLAAAVFPGMRNAAARGGQCCMRYPGEIASIPLQLRRILSQLSETTLSVTAAAAYHKLTERNCPVRRCGSGSKWAAEDSTPLAAAIFPGMRNAAARGGAVLHEISGRDCPILLQLRRITSQPAKSPYPAAAAAYPKPTEQNHLSSLRR